MNPIFANILKVVPMLLNTGLSLIRDKKKKEVVKVAGTNDVLLTDGTELIHETVESGVSLSAKRILNFAGTAIIITVALANIEANGLTKHNLVLLGIGAAYSLGMTLLTYLTERK